MAVASDDVYDIKTVPQFTVLGAQDQVNGNATLGDAFFDRSLLFKSPAAASDNKENESAESTATKEPTEAKTSEEADESFFGIRKLAMFRPPRRSRDVATSSNAQQGRPALGARGRARSVDAWKKHVDDPSSNRNVKTAAHRTGPVIAQRVVRPRAASVDSGDRANSGQKTAQVPRTNALATQRDVTKELTRRVGKQEVTTQKPVKHQTTTVTAGLKREDSTLGRKNLSTNDRNMKTGEHVSRGIAKQTFNSSRGRSASFTGEDAKAKSGEVKKMSGTVGNVRLRSVSQDSRLSAKKNVQTPSRISGPTATAPAIAAYKGPLTRARTLQQAKAKAVTSEHISRDRVRRIPSPQKAAAGPVRVHQPAKGAGVIAGIVSERRFRVSVSRRAAGGESMERVGTNELSTAGTSIQRSQKMTPGNVACDGKLRKGPSDLIRRSVPSVASTESPRPPPPRKQVLDGTTITRGRITVASVKPGTSVIYESRPAHHRRTAQEIEAFYTRLSTPKAMTERKETVRRAHAMASAAAKTEAHRMTPALHTRVIAQRSGQTSSRQHNDNRVDTQPDASVKKENSDEAKCSGVQKV